MKILVTGCQGFIGKHVCYYLNGFPNLKVIGLGRQKEPIDLPFLYLHGDITATDFVDRIIDELQTCDTIIHTAACIQEDDPHQLIEVNCYGAAQIVRLAEGLRVSQIIHFSSIPIIGVPVCLPITEEHPVLPVTLYHASKLAQEFILNLCQQSGIWVSHYRIPSPIGVGMNPRTILPIFIKSCLDNRDIVLQGTGARKQNYVDIRDICKAVYQGITNRREGIFNIAGASCISNLELADLCIALLSSSAKVLFSGKPDPLDHQVWDISIQKALQEMGYWPKYTLEDTIISIRDSMK